MAGANDIIIVGAGPAGCLAARSAADLGARVLVLEGGPRTTAAQRPLEIQAAIARNSRGNLWVRRNALQPVTDYAAGWGVGGATLVNGLLLMGATVPPLLRLSSSPGDGVLSRALREATGRVGYPRARSDRARYLGNGRERGDLGAVLDHPGIELRPLSPVDRVVRAADGSVTGVVTVQGLSVDAPVVVICTGAMETPRLLWRSGFTQPDIGRHVSDHPSWLFTAVGVDAPPVPFADSLVFLTPGADRDEFLVTSYGSSLLLTRLRSAGAGRVLPTVMESNMLASDDELRAVQAGLRALVELVHAAGLHVLGPDGTPLEHVATLSNALQRRWIAQHENGTFHATGSCLGVVDEQGWVSGAPGLRILDASTLAHVPFPPLASVLAHAASASWGF